MNRHIPRRAWAAGPAAVVAGVTAWAVIGLPAVAQATPVCTGAGGTVTCTYTYTGSEQTFVVPDGVTSLAVTAVGAAGGTGATPASGGAGGAGGEARAVSDSLTVTPGDTLYVEVGGTGGNGTTSAGATGGFNGGAAGSDSHTGGGGGGGAAVSGVPHWGGGGGGGGGSSLGSSLGLSSSPAEVVISYSSTLAITTASPLTAGTIGEAYSVTLAATGGTSPYTRDAAIGPSATTSITVRVRVNARRGRTLFATALISPSGGAWTDKVIIRKH